MAKIWYLTGAGKCEFTIFYCSSKKYIRLKNTFCLYMVPYHCFIIVHHFLRFAWPSVESGGKPKNAKAERFCKLRRLALTESLHFWIRPTCRLGTNTSVAFFCGGISISKYQFIFGGRPGYFDHTSRFDLDYHGRSKLFEGRYSDSVCTNVSEANKLCSATPRQCKK